MAWKRDLASSGHRNAKEPGVFDDLRAYFYENVVATFNAYFEVKRNGLYGASRDLRAAIVAATALYHLREHIPTAHQESRAELAQICPDYDLLGDIGAPG